MRWPNAKTIDASCVDAIQLWKPFSNTHVQSVLCDWPGATAITREDLGQIGSFDLANTDENVLGPTTGMCETAFWPTISTAIMSTNIVIGFIPIQTSGWMISCNNL